MWFYHFLLIDKWDNLGGIADVMNTFISVYDYINNS